MPVSLDLSRSSVMCLLVAGLLLAGCSSAKAPQVETTPAASALPAEASPEPRPQPPAEAPVESWELVEVDEFNAAIDAAVDSGETWAIKRTATARGYACEAQLTNRERQKAWAHLIRSGK